MLMPASSPCSESLSAFSSGCILPKLVTLLNARREEIDQWFDCAFAESSPSFYSSVDLRHSGTKLAPVDTNLFPAGFNNLSHAARQRAARQIHRWIEMEGAPLSRALIIPENHTRNLAYLANLNALRAVLEMAGLEVAMGSLAPENDAPMVLEDMHGVSLTQYPLVKEGNLLRTDAGFVPDLIVLNNDMTGGLPEILRGITQRIVPSRAQGWYRRKKSIHFAAYQKVAASFAEAFDLDPWLISAYFHKSGRIDFKEGKGLDLAAQSADAVLASIRSKYTQYGIAEDPYLFVKADSGTYGMGIMTIRSGDELLELNKKNRNKMNVIKEGVQSTEVIIQEGVPTVDMVEDHMAEPMLYLLNGVAVGGAYRVNDERDRYSNLNAKGMRFVGMCDEAEDKTEAFTRIPQCDFGAFGMVARLATLAAAREEYGDIYAI